MHWYAFLPLRPVTKKRQVQTQKWLRKLILWFNEVDSLVAETSEEQIDEEDSNDWENEVWTALGGTYCFFGDGRQYAVEFPLEENKTSATLYFGEEELEASLNPQTGLLVACDDEGNEVFRGAIYAGGNLLKGTYRGRHLEVWGSGD